MESIIITVLVIGIYFLPTIIAFKDKKRNAVAIMLLNLLAGWSVIGWIVALVWASTKDNK